ncbi:hypothetical protein L596_008214 [Steinernema carpocapsae]|uniref:Peptidase S9 prolyl oligopeptidase catalytic domain-containing protein n=1 Tax=Steinernema carpocapsae TaxID=34508 RepID=A0A4U5PCV6_STECR|nr:hypothetical protein L596_008214 [Steinernema carpocapsae]
MSRKFQCIAMNHVGVTGWSYGGYMCLMLLANHPSLYRCCVAGGAVIDWRLYDTCYTERYMGIPDDLETDIYGNSSVLSQVSRLPDESDRILICHGFMDENVHFHHTEKIVEALTKAGKHYQLLVFPSEHHGIRQPTAGEYLDANVLLFFQKALQN